MTAKFVVDKNQRIDKFLASVLPCSRGLVQQLVEEGEVELNGRVITRKSQPVEPGDRLAVELSEETFTPRIVAEDKPLEILHEDSSLLAVNKPSGIIVHPAGQHYRRGGVIKNTLVNRLLFHYPELAEVGGIQRAGLVHRLDRGTSGVLLVARSEKTLKLLQEQFKQRQVKKTYRALAGGSLEDARVRVEVPIKRHPGNPLLRIPAADGKFAVTEFYRLAAQQEVIALEAFPLTGRTHQIRVHAKYLGIPLLGDGKYGGRKAARLMLHAAAVEFQHPLTDKTLTISSNLPEVFADRWNALVH